MGRSRARTGALIALVAGSLCAAASPSLLPIRDARWLQSPDMLTDLTQQPSECRMRYNDPATEQSAQIGRIAFSAPLLLGGQAARAGISCSTCHTNGHSNPHFHFPGLSGAAGTADVTSSIMSSHRGDGIFDPVPIPDLAGDRTKLKVSRDPASNELRSFIHGLITQEFDGPEPPEPVLDGIVDYVRSLSPVACHGAALSPVNLASFINYVDVAVGHAKEKFARGDRATARLLIGAARSTLGKIDERFEVEGQEQSRAALRDASAELAAIEHSDAVTQASFDPWYATWPKHVRQLKQAEASSLFSRTVLRRALEGN